MKRMETTWKYPQERLYCNRFEFEIPLEDLYPSNYLHPKIKLMYSQALKLFKYCNVTLELLLSAENEGPEGLIEIKDSLLLYNHPKLQGSPSSFLWLIEHFLGLLPIPLFAPHINGYNFKWFKLSQECQEIFKDKNYKKRILNLEYLDHRIHKEIAKLPHQNQLLMNEHIEFMRSIAFLNKRKRRSVIYYSEYFTASLFLRPFRSGLNERKEKEYYAFIVYLVWRWRYIRKITVESSLTVNETTEQENSSIISTGTIKLNQMKSKSDINRKFCSSFKSKYAIYSSETITQPSASSIDRLSKNSEEVSSINLPVAPSAISYSNIELKNIKYKNHDVIIDKETSCIKQELAASNETFEGDKSTFEITVIEKNTHKDQPKIMNESEQNNEILDEQKENNKIDSSKIVTEHTDKKLIASSFKSVSDCDVLKNNSNRNILSRITKVGWTYTPPKNTEKQLKKNNSSDNLDDESTCQDLIEDSQSESAIKKYPKIKSFKSRLTFLNMTRKKKDENKLLKTNFKYTKINS